MKNLSSFLIALFALVILSGAQRNEGSSTLRSTTFTELPDPTDDVNSPVWNYINKGLHVSFGTIDKRYPKSLVPEVTNTKQASLTGWKGERLSAQFVLWTADGAEQVECTVGDFVSGNRTLPASIAQTRFVRYVMTDIFDPGCGYRKPEDFPASLSADMLDDIARFDIEARTARPVWVTVDVPRDAAAGTYKAEINITSKNNKKQTLTLELVVQNKILPEWKDWQYHLDLWQHPSAVARIHNLKMWSDEHFEAIRPYMELLAQTGQKVITATLNKEPWNNQCYDPYADMIIWTLKENGEWEYDYTVFDRWVQMMMDIGIKNMINCYSLVPWNNEIHYFDAKTKEFINVKADPGTEVFTDMWSPFLKNFVKHLQAKGWLSITNIAMDERPEDQMDAAIALLQEVVPELGISFADNHGIHKKYTFIKDLCFQVREKLDLEEVAARRAKGQITTYYVCCSNRFPNMFSFSDPSEAVYSAWYAMGMGYDGFLRWAYNSWVENPLTDSRFRTWPAGDTYMVYPGARSSIRLERMREGIQDVEKVRVLKAELMPLSDQASKEKLEKLDAALERFTKLSRITMPIEPSSKIVNEAKRLVIELSE